MEVISINTIRHQPSIITSNLNQLQLQLHQRLTSYQQRLTFHHRQFNWCANNCRSSNNKCNTNNNKIQHQSSILSRKPIPHLVLVTIMIHRTDLRFCTFLLRYEDLFFIALLRSEFLFNNQLHRRIPSIPYLDNSSILTRTNMMVKKCNNEFHLKTHLTSLTLKIHTSMDLRSRNHILMDPTSMDLRTNNPLSVNHHHSIDVPFKINHSIDLRPSKNRLSKDHTLKDHLLINPFSMSHPSTIRPTMSHHSIISSILNNVSIIRCATSTTSMDLLDFQLVTWHRFPGHFPNSMSFRPITSNAFWNGCKPME